MSRRLLGLAFTALTMCSVSAGVSSAAITPKGLRIAPTQQFLRVDAGKSLQNSFSVTNLSNGPLAVKLTVKQFSVADYSYTYEFSPPPNNWLTLQAPTAVLQPGQQFSVPYTISVPANAAPGSQYYTLFASATTDSGSVKTTIQAADLVYLTVNGKLLTNSVLQSSSIQRFAWGSAFSFTMTPKNTGNVYTDVNLHGRLLGLFTSSTRRGESHILLPGKPRTLTGTIATPLLPGVYRAEYGYTTTGNWDITQQAWVVFLPPWFIAILLAGALLAARYHSRYKPKSRAKEDQEAA